MAREKLLLPKALKEEVIARARDENCSVSEFTRRAIEKEVRSPLQAQRRCIAIEMPEPLKAALEAGSRIEHCSEAEFIERAVKAKIEREKTGSLSAGGGRNIIQVDVCSEALAILRERDSKNGCKDAAPYCDASIEWSLNELTERQSKAEQLEELNATAAHAFLSHYRKLCRRSFADAVQAFDGLAELINKRPGLMRESLALCDIVAAARKLDDLAELLKSGSLRHV